MVVYHLRNLFKNNIKKGMITTHKGILCTHISKRILMHGPKLIQIIQSHTTMSYCGRCI